MTIYDPSGEQKIISGRHLVNMNEKFNKEMNYLKSRAKKCNKIDSTTDRMKKLLIKRNNKINNYFNLICKWFEKNYSGKTIIIGYNVNWKKNVNMGKNNNRTFYQIPYKKLLEKLKFKMLQKGSKVVQNEESYTSKCDSLSLEEIKKQEEYLGKRVKRGLFSSAIRKLINADLNGAINIMRKHLAKIGIEIDVIYGKSIFNPQKVNIYQEVIQKFSITTG